MNSGTLSTGKLFIVVSPASNRSKLHLSLGERLMPICTEGKPEIAAEVALHFEEGRDYKRSVQCLMLAAGNATKRFLYRDSIRVLHKALELVDSLAPEARLGLDVEVLRRIGDAHYALGEMSDSAVSYEAAAELAARAGIKTSQVTSLIHLAVPLWYIDPARGNEVSEQAVKMSRELGDPVLAAQTQLAAASCRLIYDAWRKEDADICARAEATLRDIGGSGTPSDVFNVYVHVFQGNYQEAERLADALLETTINPTAHVLASGARSLTILLRGRFGEVLQTIRTERELAEKNGEEPWMWLFGETWLRGMCFDFEGVRRVTEISMRSDTERHAAWTKAVAKVACGYAEFYQGNLEGALQCFADVRDFRTTPKFFLHWHWRLHAELGATEAFLHAGDIANARREADGFLRSALSTAEPNMQAHAWDVKSRAASAGKDFDCALECIDHALALLDRFEIPLAGWQVHRSAWDLYAQLGEREKAQSHRAQAQELITRIADTFEPGEPLRESFLTAPPIRRIFEQHTSA